MPKRFSIDIIATPEDIDELGHVNNAVWVRWIQQVSTAHWQAVATPAQQEACLWIVTRHEIDYRGNVAAGTRVSAQTWLDELPRGARFNRNVEFLTEDGTVIVAARTTWALLDRESGRLMRVRADIIDRFMGSDG